MGDMLAKPDPPLGRCSGLRGYPIGLRYTKKDIDALPITRHDFHGDWNYTLKPQPDTP